MNPGDPRSLREPLKDPETHACDPLLALQEGDPGPFEAFVGSHTRRFLGFFERLGAPRSESDDLVQETFLKLYRLAAHSDSITPAGPRTHTGPGRLGASYVDRGQFLAYAFRVARNVWIDRTRRLANGPGRTEDNAADLSISVDARRPGRTTPAPGAAVEILEESLRIREAVSALPESHRLVVELGILQELPYSEIAEALEIPVGTVKSRMFNALKRVKATLSAADQMREGQHQRRVPNLPSAKSPRGQAS